MVLSTLKQPYGITVPITHGNGGYFNQSYTVLDQIKCNLVNFLNTRKGERRLNPNFGSDLYKIIFEFNDDEIPALVESTIRKDISTWMPFLTIQSVSVDVRTEQKDIYTVDITVKFTIDSIGVTKAQIVSFNVNKPII